MTHWTERYVGIPYLALGRGFDGVDCYGLARLILDQECGVRIPAYADADPCVLERAELARLIDEGRGSVWHRAEAIRPFDLLLFRMGGQDSHIGVAIDPRMMIHAHRDQAKVARLDDPAWRSRLVGAWRHEELMA